MSDEESMCIFCEELIPADSEECPHCSKKPFSGMYFDPETYKTAEELEKKGELDAGRTASAAGGAGGEVSEKADPPDPLHVGTLRNRDNH